MHTSLRKIVDHILQFTTAFHSSWYVNRVLALLAGVKARCVGLQVK